MDLSYIEKEEFLDFLKQNYEQKDISFPEKYVLPLQVIENMAFELESINITIAKEQDVRRIMLDYNDPLFFYYIHGVVEDQYYYTHCYYCCITTNVAFICSCLRHICIYCYEKILGDPFRDFKELLAYPIILKLENEIRHRSCNWHIIRNTRINNTKELNNCIQNHKQYERNWHHKRILSKQKCTICSKILFYQKDIFYFCGKTENYCAECYVTLDCEKKENLMSSECFSKIHFGLLFDWVPIFRDKEDNYILCNLNPESKEYGTFSLCFITERASRGISGYINSAQELLTKLHEKNMQYLELRSRAVNLINLNSTPIHLLLKSWIEIL